MKQRYIKLSEYAKKNAVIYKTAHKWYKEGKIKNTKRTITGGILVLDDQEETDNEVCVAYARVSSNKQKDQLDTQVKRLKDYSASKGWELKKVYKEVASGMNDQRTKLMQLLDDDTWDILIVENKDRLTRFGFNYLEVLLNKRNKKIKIINTSDDEKDDLMKDLISVIHSFSARMYGLRRKKNKQEIINFLEN